MPRRRRPRPERPDWRRRDQQRWVRRDTSAGGVADAEGHFGFSKFFVAGQAHGCWPSGHVSGDFALLALGMLDRRPIAPLRMCLYAAGLGTAIGAYQIARDAHFVSHGPITALIAQTPVCLLAVVLSLSRVSSVSALHRLECDLVVAPEGSYRV